MSKCHIVGNHMPRLITCSAERRLNEKNVMEGDASTLIVRKDCSASLTPGTQEIKLKSTTSCFYSTRKLKNQKSIDFLLNPFFVFRNDLYVNVLHYMYTCCYTKMK